MDFLSIAGFALNVVSYLKENPLDFGDKIEEPVAVAETAPKSRALADIKMPVEPRVVQQQKLASHNPKGVGSYQKRTTVRDGGQLSMARVEAEAEASDDLLAEKTKSRTKLT